MRAGSGGMTMRRTSWRAAVAALPLALLAGAALAQPAEQPSLTAAYGENTVAPVYVGATTIIGQPVAYPAGDLEVTNAIVTIQPGNETGWHTHSVPLFVYILSGTVTVDYGSKGTHTVSTGSSFFEAMDWPHNAHNYGDVPVRILAVYLGVEGATNADPATGPE